MCFIHFPSAPAISVPRYDQPPPLPPPITYQPRPPERNQPVLVPANPYHTAEIPDWLQVYARAPLKWVHTLRYLHTTELGVLVISEAPRSFRPSSFCFVFSALRNYAVLKLPVINTQSKCSAFKTNCLLYYENAGKLWCLMFQLFLFSIVHNQLQSRIYSACFEIYTYWHLLLIENFSYKPRKRWNTAYKDKIMFVLTFAYGN